MARVTPVFVGTVDGEGRLRLEGRQLFDRYLQRLKNRPVELTIKVRSRRKSHSLMGYLWGVVYPVIAEALGYADYEIDALHDALMREVRGLKPEPNPLGLRVSLATMDHDEASAYVTDVRHYALMELGIVTPDPERVEARGRKTAA
ncbi:MAG TPA: hypothetical protein VNL98_07110 [Gemmatimonadales bacterium]|nr:hypothetical protein [Gemmatimonadales bacterium]